LHRPVALILAALFTTSLTAAQPTLPLSLRAKPVALLPDGADRIGHLRVLGMLELPSLTVDGQRFAQLSDLAWDEDEQLLYAISDKGALFWLRPVFTRGRLTDVVLVKAVALDAPGPKTTKSYRADSEGLDIEKGRNGRKGDSELLISFERYPRVARHRPDGRWLRDHDLPAALTNIKNYQEPNKGLEALAIHPTIGILTAPEAPFKDEARGYSRIVSLDGRAWRYPLGGNYHIVAMQALDERSLLVLERDYRSLLGGMRIALRRVTLPAKDDEPLAPDTLVELSTNDGHTIDNFEGLAGHRGRRYFLVSDDNDIFLQRTLLLYVEVVE
jgi:hypothetical protein